MNLSSGHFDPEVDEFAVTGLTPADCVHVKVPRVKEAPVSLECVFHQRIRLPSTSPKVENNVVFGRVVGIHISDDIIVDGRVDMMKSRPIARLGYMDYKVLDNVFSLARPHDKMDTHPPRPRTGCTPATPP